MQRGITVTGTGVASGVRDTCTLDLGAESRDRTADAALSAASDCLRAMREELLAAGVPTTALASGDISLSPVYDQWPTVSGYAASLRLSAQVPDVASAGRLIGQVVAAGGDDARVHAVTFGHADPAALAARARLAAFDDARDRANALAARAGHALGEVLAVEEVDSRGGLAPRPVHVKAVAAAADVPIDAGEGSLDATVRVRWALV